MFLRFSLWRVDSTMVRGRTRCKPHAYLSRFFRLVWFIAFFKGLTTHVFEGQEARPGRLKIGADAPVIAQRTFERKEVFATTATIRSPMVRSAARPIRFEIRWKLSNKLPQEVMLRHAGSWFGLVLVDKPQPVMDSSARG